MKSGYVYVLLCYILVGISYPVAEASMASIPVWTFITITFAIGFVFMYVLSLITGSRSLFSINLAAWGAISIQSLLGAILYTAFLLYGFTYASAITASVFTSISPAIVLILSWLMLRERITSRKGVAILLAVAGVLCLTLPGSGSSGQTSLAGILFLALSTLSVSGCVIAAKKYDVELPAMTMATGVCFTGMVFSLPMALLMEAGSFDMSILSSSNMLTMVYYGVLVWAVPYFCFFSGVTKIPASATGMALAMVPLASSVFSICFYGQSMQLTDGIALLLVVSSVFLAEAAEPASDSAEIPAEPEQAVTRQRPAA